MNEKLLQIKKSAQAIYDACIVEDREPTDEERDQLKKLYDEGKEIQQRILEKNADAELKAAIMGLDAKEYQPERKGNTLGHQVIESLVFKNWMKAIAPNGRIPDSMKGIVSPPIEVKDFGLFTKTLVTGASDTSAGALIQNDVSGIIETIGHYPRVARDLISVLPTSSDTVEYVQQTAQVSQAAPTAEATSLSDGAKPEGAMALAKKTTPVETIAVWIPITKRALSDAPQVREIINQDLLGDLADELENQIFNGDGSSPNLKGIATYTNASDGLLEQAYATDLLTTTRKAVTNLLKNGKDRPTAWVMSPADWESFCLLQDGDNRYYFGGPLSAAQDRLWGIPVVVSYHVADGFAYLANWKRARLFDRQAASISISDSHSDFFIKNLVAILAELRAAFAITRPASFVKVDLTAV